MVASGYTDAEGYYEIWVSPGTYDLHLSHPSFGDTVIAGIVVELGVPTEIPPVELPPVSGYEYLPGDVNMYSATWPPVAIGGDVTYLVNYFRGIETSIACELDGFWCSADANGDCNTIGSDVTRLVNYFRGQIDLLYCPDYPPAWPTPDDLPVDAPPGWPNCETPPMTGKVFPSGPVK